MIQVTDKSRCCGCNACGDVCPKDAISFHIDIERLKNTSKSKSFPFIYQRINPS